MGLKESMAEIFIKWTFSLLKDQSQFVKEMKKTEPQKRRSITSLYHKPNENEIKKAQKKHTCGFHFSRRCFMFFSKAQKIAQSI